MPTTVDYPAEALKALREAWAAVIADYDERLLNSERCVQASIYHHLRMRLKVEAGFKIFIEPHISINGEKPRYIDLLVSHCHSIVLALELKYKPNSKPSNPSVSADLTKLLQMKYRRASADRTTVEIRRFLAKRDQKIALAIAPRSFAVFAAFVKQKGFYKTREEFWQEHRRATIAPNGQPANSMPLRLAVLLAETELGRETAETFWAMDKTLSRAMLASSGA